MIKKRIAVLSATLFIVLASALPANAGPLVHRQLGKVHHPIGHHCHTAKVPGFYCHVTRAGQGSLGNLGR